ncbi:MAG: phosphate ABC transporter substrate-binding protein [Myxococcota bacterium]
MGPLFGSGGLALGIVLGCFVSLGGCSSGEVDSDSVLVLTGSSTLAPITSELAQRYEALHPGVRIDVQSGGSSRGIADARNGLAEIGMVSRALKAEEGDLHVETIARDGVGIVVHESNPVRALDRSQVVALYQGRIDSWKTVGGHDAAPVVVHKADGRATQAVFLDHFGLDAAEVRADVIVGENEQAIKTAVGNPNSVAYVSIGSARLNIERGSPLKLIPIDGVIASVETLRSGLYPIARPLNFVTRETPTGLAADFIEFVRSEAMREVFAAQSFVQVDA